MEDLKIDALLGKTLVDIKKEKQKPMDNINELITYSITDGTIATMRAEFMKLRVNSYEDRAGYAACHKARQEVKQSRIEVEKRRKELKADSMEFGRRVDSEAKRITQQLSEIEDHLHAQQKIVDDEKARREEEKRKAEQRRIDDRRERLAALHVVKPIDWITNCSDEDFLAFEAEAKEAREKELARREEERKRLAQLEAERLEQEKKIKEQEAEARKAKELADQRERELQEEAARLKAEILARETAARAEAERRAVEEIERRLKAEAVARAEKAKADAEARAIKEEAESVKCAQEAKEREAAEKIADAQMFEDIKDQFPTLDLAWIEIARLWKGE